ncbi:MAG TPA: hypothetical protein VHH91_07560, partial [Vicinamibacterales bacterium]|nr:hypothetical protein [Vicinamibacterales bacterium]
MTHSLMRRDFRATSHVRPFAAALLLAWVLAAHVFVAFPRARTKLVTRPVAVAPRVALPLDAAARMPGEEVVLVYRVRNAGTAPLVVTARLGDRVLRDVRIAGGASTRVDLTFPRALVRVGGHSIELSGSADWTLEYAELANLHGFTRGPVEFLVLPAVQPFLAPGLPTVVAFAACALAAAGLGLPRLPRWAQLAHGAATAAVVTLFLLAIVSPWVTPYRVVFAVHTFVLGAAVVALPRGLHVLVEAGRSEAAALIARRAAALRWKPLGICLAAGAYVVLLWSHMGATAGQSDSSGYMNNARLIASGRVTAPMRDVPGVLHNLLPARAYVPLGFRPHGRDALAPTYPVGLALMLVAAVPALGWAHAPGVVMLLHALAGVALTALLARSCGLPGAAALVAA